MELPSGRVTFLFTDIEGSTSLFHRLGEAYVPMLEDHHRLIREALAAHRGCEVRTEGDAFFAAFSDPADALAATLQAQLALADHDWKHGEPVLVRMGLHVGPVEIVNDDYVGLSVHEAARVGSAGHGGQILVSDEFVTEVGERVPADAGFRDLGRHALKDFPQPRNLFQVTHPRLRVDHPPLRTLTAKAHNLPRFLTPFTARGSEVHELVSLLAGEERLVTVTGMGGIGKTRLAVEAGWQLLSWFSDGVWLVSLASVDRPENVASAVAHALGLVEEPGRSPEDQLTAHLAESTSLLILDNFEHLLDAATFVSDLLAGSDHLKILATSRERLRLRGENEIAVAPLAVPDADDPATLLASPAVELFVDRVRSLLRGFVLDETTAGAVASICRRLDGIPLALELAAGQVRSRSLDEVAGGLDRALDLLGEGERDLPERQQALRAAIAWSDELLEPVDRLVLRATSVFRGGFTLPALEFVASAIGVPPGEAGASAHRLADKALLVPLGERPGGERFSLLEPIRQYSAEQLDGVPGAEAAAPAHAGWYLALVESLQDDLVGAGQKQALDSLDTELANLRLALQTAEGEDALRLGAGLVRFYSYRGHWREGVDTLQRLASGELGPTGVRARILMGLGNLAVLQGDDQLGASHLEEAVALAAAAADSVTEALAANLLAGVADRLGEVSDASDWWRQAVAAAARAGDDRTEALIRQSLGTAAVKRGELAMAADEYQAALRAQERLGDQVAMAQTLSNLGAVAKLREDLPSAEAMYGKAHATANEVGARQTQYTAAINLSQLLYDTDPPAARVWVDRAIEAAGDLSPADLGRALEIRGQLRFGEDADGSAMLSDWQAAADCYRQAGMEDELGRVREQTEALRRHLAEAAEG